MKIFHIYQKNSPSCFGILEIYIYLIFDNKYIFLELSEISLSKDIRKLLDMSASALIGAHMLKEYVIRECKKRTPIN